MLAASADWQLRAAQRDEVPVEFAAHDYALELSDETVAEVQSAVVQLRQLGTPSGEELLTAMGTTLARLLATGDPREALTLAAQALRHREEYSGVSL